MPVEAPFCQACLLHHRADAARVPAVLPDRAGSHGKNLLPVPRFVFQRISHVLRVRSYSLCVKTKIDLAYARTAVLQTRERGSTLRTPSFRIRFSNPCHVGYVSSLQRFTRNDPL